MSAIRSIGWYKPYSDKLKGERILNASEYERIAGLFTPKEGDADMLDSYPISEPHAAAIAEITGLRFNLDSYEYFLESWKAGA